MPGIGGMGRMSTATSIEAGRFDRDLGESVSSEPERACEFVGGSGSGFGGLIRSSFAAT